MKAFNFIIRALARKLIHSCEPFGSSKTNDWSVIRNKLFLTEDTRLKSKTKLTSSTVVNPTCNNLYVDKRRCRCATTQYRGHSHKTWICISKGALQSELTKRTARKAKFFSFHFLYRTFFDLNQYAMGLCLIGEYSQEISTYTRGVQRNSKGGGRVNIDKN